LYTVRGTSSIQIPLFLSSKRLLVLHQFLHRFLDILRLREDEVFKLRGVADKGVGCADAADGRVEEFEKLVGDTGGDLCSVAIRDRVFVSDDDTRSFLDGF